MTIKIILTGKVSSCIFLRRLVFMNLDPCKGGFLRAEFEKMDERSSLTGEIRGKELLTGIELVRDKEKTPANTGATKIRDFCCEKGLLIGQGGVFGNVLRIQPPCMISPKQMEKMLEALDQAFQKV